MLRVELAFGKSKVQRSEQLIIWLVLEYQLIVDASTLNTAHTVRKVLRNYINLIAGRAVGGGAQCVTISRAGRILCREWSLEAICRTGLIESRITFLITGIQ